MSDFHFQEMFELGADETPYRKLTSEHVSHTSSAPVTWSSCARFSTTPRPPPTTASW